MTERKNEQQNNSTCYGAASEDYYDQFMKRNLEYYGYLTETKDLLKEDFETLEIKQKYDTRLSGKQRIIGVEEEFDDYLNRTTQLVCQYQSGRKVHRLREPRGLYALTKEAGPQQATRWPSHIRCICPAVHFIDYVPSSPEPLLKPTGQDPTPSVKGGEVFI